MTVSTIISVLSLLLKVVNVVMQKLHDDRLLKAGRMEVIVEQMEKLNAIVVEAKKVEEEAAEAHAKDSTDNAFDKRFER